MIIHDQVLIDRAQMKEARRIVKDAIRANGGSWKCPGCTHRRISANKNLCAQCELGQASVVELRSQGCPFFPEAVQVGALEV